MTQENFCPLRVKWELFFAESAGENSYLLFSHEFDVFYILQLCLARSTTSILRYEWHEDWAFQKIVATTHFSSFTMTFISFVHSASFSRVRRKKSFFPSGVRWEVNFAANGGQNWYLLTYDNFCVLSTFCQFQPGTTQSELSSLWVTGYLDYSKVFSHSRNRPFYEDFDIGRTFCTFTPCKTQDKFSPSWVTCELNSSKSAGGNSYLPFHDDFDVSCTLSCNSSRTHDQFCPLWVIGELSFPESTKDKSNLLFYDDFNVVSTFGKFEPRTTEDNFWTLQVKWYSTLQKVLETTQTFFPRWLLRRWYVLQVWVLYDAQPVFRVMSDVRTQLFFRYRKYILEGSVLYDPRRVFSVMSDVST